MTMVKKESYLFTSESVSEGHPDKICDQISDMVVDAYLSKDPNKYINRELLKKELKERAVADFIAGMTDRYAINLYKKIK